MLRVAAFNPILPSHITFVERLLTRSNWKGSETLEEKFINRIGNQ